MKIRVIGSKDEIAQLDPRERVVHLAVPITTLLLLELIKRCPRLEAVQVPPSKFSKVSKPSRGLLEVQGVKIFPGLVWGHRTDMYAYYTVDDGAILKRVGEHLAEGMGPEEIVAKVAREVEVSPGLVGFIIDSRLRPSPIR
ncbi:MAG: DUF1699 family protein [Methanothrix sp.]|nr:DUF1699 family protein [Methanothrix sp.]MDD5049220.1 DUF1699 family protein [Methanoregulaceae archaeon]MDD5515461.1 DUF1699 family protein [Synergistales bacterium]